MLIAALVLVAIVVMRPPPSAETTAPTVLEGQTDIAGNSAPSQAEIARAQARLGSDGFVAYVTCNQVSQYHAAQVREIGDFATHYGLKFRIYDSNNDKYNQIAQIERARADGVTGLIICPLDVATLDDTLKSAQEAGMPLVQMSSNSASYGGVLIGGDDYLMGLEAGRAAGRMIRDEMDGTADVIILDYPDLDILIRRADGLQDGVLEFAPQAHIIGRYLGATQENAQNSVSKLLRDNVSFNVILSINDAGSYGAIQAMEAADIDPSSVIISSVDAEFGGARLHPARATSCALRSMSDANCLPKPPSTPWSSCWQVQPCQKPISFRRDRSLPRTISWQRQM